MEQPTTNQPTMPETKPKYTTGIGEPLNYPSQILPGLGNAQILPDWVHNRLRKLFKRSTLSS
ncbi:MAG: hypothetical protein ACLPUT_07770 [Solirubrobacteraceae bacterium]